MRNAGSCIGPLNIEVPRNLAVGPFLLLFYTISLRNLIYARSLKYINVSMNFNSISSYDILYETHTTTPTPTLSHILPPTYLVNVSIQ